jgi:hypothetical protein
MNAGPKQSYDQPPVPANEKNVAPPRSLDQFEGPHAARFCYNHDRSCSEALSMNATLSGTIHGRTIQLDDDAGLPDGAEVRVLVVPKDWRPGDGILASAKSWVGIDDATFKQWLTEMYRSRDEDPRGAP